LSLNTTRPTAAGEKCSGHPASFPPHLTLFSLRCLPLTRELLSNSTSAKIKTRKTFKEEEESSKIHFKNWHWKGAECGGEKFAMIFMFTMLVALPFAFFAPSPTPSLLLPRSLVGPLIDDDSIKINIIHIRHLSIPLARSTIFTQSFVAKSAS
jgi:hypothetical protein